VREYFSFAARFLKDNRILKESMFEKPYLQPSRPQMHQDWSTPDWPTTPVPVGPGGDGDYRKHTFIFNEGMCGASLMGEQDCGEQVTISTWIGAAPLFSTNVRDISCKAVSSNPDIAQIISQDTDGLGNTTFVVKLAEEGEDEAEICINCSLESGKMLKELSYLIPPIIDGIKITPGWIPRLEYAMNNLMPSSETYVSPDWDCGCITITLDCCGVGEISWDDDVSGDTVGDSSSVLVSINDTGNSGPYTWSVSGIGFFTDAERTKTTKVAGKSTFIYTNADSCGGCVITVVNCDGSSTATGGVRSTNGKWGTVQGLTCVLPGEVTYGSCAGCYTDYYCSAQKISGIYKQTQRVGLDQYATAQYAPYITECLTGYDCGAILCNVNWVNDGSFHCSFSTEPDSDHYLRNYYMNGYEWEC